MRKFPSGATRDDDTDKLDFEAFLSPLVIRRYAEYLHKHRIQADGKIREADNWQRGISLSCYIKSLFRHFIDLWTIHRRNQEKSLDWFNKEEALCAIIFNASGYLHELLKAQSNKPAVEQDECYSTPPFENLPQ